ncbi:zinc finger, CCHC-type containing protein [Tanacetum coccineum]
MQKESVSKQGRKPAKAEPTVHKDPAFDDLDDDAMAYIETEDAQDEGKTSSVVLEEKESADKEVSTEVPVSTVKPKKKEKEKGVEIRDAKNSDRPRATSTRSVLTLKPLLKIDPKDKGKKVLEEEAESDAESELVEEEATKVALTNEYDFIHARINADKILAKELQKEEREKFTVEQRAKFLHDTIAAQRKFLAQQSIDGGKKHSDLKTKTFEEIQEMNEESKDPEKKRLRRGLLMKKTQQRVLNSPCFTVKSWLVQDQTVPVLESKNGAENGAKNKPIKKAEKEEVVKAPSSRPIEYYLKHMINEKLIEGLVDNNRFNDSLSGARVRKVMGKTYNVLPRGPIYEAILKKKITKKEDIGGNFEIPCSIGGLKHVNTLVDQGSDVNIMPYSTYVKLTDERPAETNIRLSLASHSYIYPLRIAEDVLVEVAEHVYPVDFVILDIKENEKRPFILGTPLLTMAKAVIKFDKGTITLRSGKSKIRFHRIPESPYIIERGVKNDIEPIAPTMTVNRLVLEWEKRIKLHLKREIEFNRWKSKNFKGKHPTLVIVEGGMNDEEEVTLYLMRRILEVLRKFHWMILGGRFFQLSHVSSPLLGKPGEC